MRYGNAVDALWAIVFFCPEDYVYTRRNVILILNPNGQLLNPGNEPPFSYPLR